MTFLIAGLCTLWVALWVSLAGVALRTTELDARAQAAADAAALAAIAESLPGGGGQPRVEAVRYAAANGGRVIECLCNPGATAAQVRVAVGNMQATARAVFDPSLLRPRTAAPRTHRGT
ncbi:MAG: hypothetical protein ACRDI3_01720 [Actinomycetota bacterium]